MKGAWILKIIVYGAYGSGNIGDEATLDVLLEHFTKVAPESRIVVFSADPKETEIIHSVKSSRPSLLAIIKADTLIIEDLDTVFKFFAGFLGRVLGKKVIYYAVGAPKLTLLMKMMIPLALNVNEICVRDVYSKKMFERYGLRRGIRVVPDPALQLKPIEKSQAKQILETQGVDVDQFLVGLSLRYSRTEELDNQVKQVMASIVNWLVKERNAEIVFIPMCKHRRAKLDKDELFGEELRRLINAPDRFTILRGVGAPREIKGIFSVMNICIGMRLHSAVFAYSVGVSYIGLVTGWVGYDEKILSFMKSFCKQNPFLLSSIDLNSLEQKVIELTGR
jgi:polysaccharide pyruvyl transferase WcaK-like protein